MVDEEKNKEDIPEDEPGNEEPVSEETAPRSEGPEAGSLENRVTRLADALEGFSSELETIQLNLQKRKRETTTLKILFYTGLIVLLVGFLYTNFTLQRAQLKSLESNLASLQTQINQRIQRVEQNLFNEVNPLQNQVALQNNKLDEMENRMSKEARIRNGKELPVVLKHMNEVLGRIEPQNQTQTTLIQQVQTQSEELLQAYRDHRKELSEEATSDSKEPPAP